MMIPESIVRSPAAISTIHMVMWIPTCSFDTDEPKWNVTCSKCCDANQPAVYAPTA